MFVSSQLGNFFAWLLAGNSTLRRLLHLCRPTQVEATKYTELGYVGRDVEDMIKDLVEASISSTKQRLREALASHAAAATEDILLKAIVGEFGAESMMESFRCGAVRPCVFFSFLVF